MAYYKERKRNTPIATLIRNYVNKKSGLVTDSREEIQRRFDYLDWKDQKKILSVFLDSGKTDRQWAYSKVLDYWDKSFEPKIKELWEHLHEDKCSWVVIRHFPIDYISQNLDEFTSERDYFFICLRLAEDKDYIIERDKLSKTDYLAVIYHTGRSIDEKEAEDILFDTVHDICLDCDSILALDRYADVSKGTIISPKCFHSVSLALYYIRMLGYNSLSRDFDEWNEKVTKAILDSPESKEMSKYGESEFEYRFRMIKVARRYAYLLLDEKYKKTADPTIEEMLKSKYWCRLDDDDVLKDLIADDPAFGKLVDVLALEANDYCQSDFPPDINDVNDYGKRAVSYSHIDTNVNNELPF